MAVPREGFFEEGESLAFETGLFFGENGILFCMLKALLSDYDGVLIPDEYRGANAFCRDVTWLERAEVPYYTLPSASGFWEEIRQTQGASFSNQELARLYNLEDAEQIRQQNEVLDLYRSFKSVTPLLLLLSNQIADRTAYLRQKEALSLFDVCYFSSELGLKKPQPEIFQMILKRHQLLPEEVLFIDDAEENVRAAEVLGMQVILFQSVALLEQELLTCRARA